MTMKGNFVAKDTIRNKKQLRQEKNRQKTESQAGKSWKKPFLFLFFRYHERLKTADEFVSPVANFQ